MAKKPIDLDTLLHRLDCDVTGCNQRVYNEAFHVAIRGVIQELRELRGYNKAFHVATRGVIQELRELRKRCERLERKDSK